MAAQPPLNFFTVLSESKRIIHAHSRHFLALSVLFLLPYSFFSSTQSLSFSPLLNQSISLTLIYSLFVSTLYLVAVGPITYSVYQGFYGRPVNQISAIKSIFTSFLPLVATAIATQVILFGIFIVFGLVCLLVLKGFQIDYSSPYIIAFSVGFLVLVMIYLQVNWTLVQVIVVAESSWGFEALKRSARLIKGSRGVALCSLLFFVGFAMLLLWSKGKIGGGWKSWAFVVNIVVTSAFFTLLTLYNLAVNTVLYMYCKAANGELALEKSEEFAREYVSLPFDDGKVPHVDSVVYT